MDFVDSYVSRESRFSVGQELASGRYYVSIPVSNGVVDYEEYYELDPEHYAELLANPGQAIPFVEECRQRQHDDRLIQKPGRNRGTPV